MCPNAANATLTGKFKQHTIQFAKRFITQTILRFWLNTKGVLVLDSAIDATASMRWQQHQPTTSPWLHEEIARRMQQRLDCITIQPQSWIHWDAAKGGLQAHRHLQQRYIHAQCIQADMRDIQRTLSTVDLLWANMTLHMVADPQALLHYWQRCLQPDGFIMFSLLGAGSLPELRNIYQKNGWHPPCHHFADMHNWGDSLLQAGFAEPILDAEYITLTFTSPQRVLQELRELGHNLSSKRSTATRTKTWLQQWYAAAQTLATKDGTIPLTFEIIYGHAMKAAQGHNAQGEATIDIMQMRRMLRRSLS